MGKVPERSSPYDDRESDRSSAGRTQSLPVLTNLDDIGEGTEETFIGRQSPAPAAEAAPESAEGQVFVVVASGPLAGQAFVLSPGAPTLVGRAPECTIRVNELGVSRQHLRIRSIHGECEVEDLGSANGTFLNGVQIHGTYRLHHGDRLRVGASTVLRIDVAGHDHDSVREAPHSARAVMPWSPASWRQKPAAQQPSYEPGSLAPVLERLRRLPPLVTSWEIERLRQQIAEAQAGDRFWLQGGDCAETILDCQPDVITDKLKILLQMSLVLTHAARKPIIRVGRLAGQYAKPRSRPTEIRDGVELPSYLGDLVNRPEFTAAARRHDPELLVTGYQHAMMTMNFVRALSAGGFSDLRRAEYFDLSIFERADLSPEMREDYHRLSAQIADGLQFMRAFGTAGMEELTKVEFFCSHEGLNLDYESAQTRQVPRRDGWYSLTTHFPWIGERTRALSGAHIEFYRGIRNPVGVKIGPSTTPEDIVELARALNPNDEPGRLVFIVRMGAGVVTTKLPPLLDAIRRSRRRVLWVSDPMHGNGIVTKTGLKTRNFDAILQELEESFDVHESCGTRIGGIHFELTGEDVTECIGEGTSEADLDTRYLTACDPRLNYRQAIAMAFRIAGRIGTSSVRRTSSDPPPRFR